jgi:PilZ domain-containing protein
MRKHAEPAPAATGLVLSKDPVAIRLLVDSLKPFAIRLQICADSLAAIGFLNRQKFEAVIADLESAEDAALVMRQVHLSASNRTAVSFVITAGPAHAQAAARPDSTFVLERPLSVESISGTFRAAFGMLVRERRRYFRCPLEVTAFVRAQQPEELLCQLANISEGGLAIRASGLSDQASASVRFTLPGVTGQFFAETIICWRGENGMVGLEFVSIPRKSELQEWLARKFDESLPESVAQLFRGAGPIKSGA